MVIEIALIFGLLVLVTWSNGRLGKKIGLSKVQYIGLQLLWIYHISFSFVFYYYLQKNGGDAIRYWNLTADLSQGAESWGNYWGRGTFFLQWLNYIPSKVLGMGFLSGNVLYGVVSFLGIREIYFVGIKYWPESSSKWIEMGWLGLFFLPNLHFWSSGVGKEALLILGMGLAVKGLVDLRRHWILLVVGVVLSFWVRPIAGLVLGMVAWIYFLFQSGISVRAKSAVSTLMFVIGVLALNKVLITMHIEEYSMAALQQFSAGQFEFLEGFGAGSEVPMEGYGWTERLWAIFFRPFWNDVRDFWDVASAIENSIAILLLIGLMGGLVYCWVKKKLIIVPNVFYAGLAVAVLMAVVFSMTLNNLGIMMRMKSTYMIFCYLTAFRILFLMNKSYHCNH